MCPPYELVDYNELYDLLDTSPLLHEVQHSPVLEGREECPAAALGLAVPASRPAAAGLALTPSPLLPALPCPLLQESIVIVEYPKKLASLVRERLGPLEKLRDRRYGRTYLAIYGPPLTEA